MSGAATDEKPHIRLRREAMDCLARREHSFQELLSRLSEKHPDYDRGGLIEPVLRQLADEQLQSDERFVEAYVRYKRNRGAGPLKIQSELYHKGVDAALVRRHLYSEDNDWTELARQALEKKYGGTVPASPKEEQRRHRFLAQRGFESEQIRAALKKFFSKSGQ